METAVASAMTKHGRIEAGLKWSCAKVGNGMKTKDDTEEIRRIRLTWSITIPA